MSVPAKAIQFCAAKNEWNDGNRVLNTSNCTTTSMIAAEMSMIAHVKAAGVKNQLTYL